MYLHVRSARCSWRTQVYETSIDDLPDESSVTSLLLKIDWEIQKTQRLGSFVFYETEGFLYTSRVHPFWEKIYLSHTGECIFEQDDWRHVLLKKWIARTLEYILLHPFSQKDLYVCRDPTSSVSDMRLQQLEKLGVNNCITIREYLQRFKPHMPSPHFDVVYPSI